MLGTELSELAPSPSSTFKIPMLLTTGAEMVVMRKRMVAARRRKLPVW